MSRSRRKHPYITEQNKGRPQRGFAKRLANRAVRAAKDVANGKAYRKESNSWDITDYKFYDAENPKARRK